jgi:hypothetical protein
VYGAEAILSSDIQYDSPRVAAYKENVTSQDFIKFWREIFVFVLFVLIEISQRLKTF